MIDKIEAIAAAIGSIGPTPEKSAERPAKPATPEPAKPAVDVEPTYGFRLRVDEQTKEVVAVIVDPVTQAPIREIPAKEMRVAADIIRNLLGPLVDKVV
jgi:FlaG protein